MKKTIVQIPANYDCLISLHASVDCSGPPVHFAPLNGAGNVYFAPFTEIPRSVRKRTGDNLSRFDDESLVHFFFPSPSSMRSAHELNTDYCDMGIMNSGTHILYWKFNAIPSNDGHDSCEDISGLTAPNRLWAGMET